MRWVLIGLVIAFFVFLGVFAYSAHRLFTGLKTDCGNLQAVSRCDAGNCSYTVECTK